MNSSEKDSSISPSKFLKHACSVCDSEWGWNLVCRYNWVGSQTILRPPHNLEANPNSEAASQLTTHNWWGCISTGKVASKCAPRGPKMADGVKKVLTPRFLGAPVNLCQIRFWSRHQQQRRYSWYGQMSPWQMLTGKMSTWWLESVVDC